MPYKRRPSGARVIMVGIVGKGKGKSPLVTRDAWHEGVSRPPTRGWLAITGFLSESPGNIP
ncbi:MAG: hypothetical protein ACYSTG_10140, partial [Planctomycetota bacterium]